MLFHIVTRYINSLLSHIHVNTTDLLTTTCTLVGTGVILEKLECYVLFPQRGRPLAPGPAYPSGAQLHCLGPKLWEIYWAYFGIGSRLVRYDCPDFLELWSQIERDDTIQMLIKEDYPLRICWGRNIFFRLHVYGLITLLPVSWNVLQLPRLASLCSLGPLHTQG